MMFNALNALEYRSNSFVTQDNFTQIYLAITNLRITRTVCYGYRSYITITKELSGNERSE